jgi:hypothetical protein
MKVKKLIKMLNKLNPEMEILDWLPHESSFECMDKYPEEFIVEKLAYYMDEEEKVYIHDYDMHKVWFKDKKFSEPKEYLIIV